MLLNVTITTIRTIILEILYYINSTENSAAKLQWETNWSYLYICHPKWLKCIWKKNTGTINGILLHILF